jgi:cytochrome c-type biogenesis protein CcmE
MVADPPAVGQPVRLGGMVQAGTLATEADGVTIRFVVGDGEAQVPVRYSGIVPDLFIEGSGVVAEGRMRPDGIFIADNLLAKHDENYIPRELQDMTEAQKRAAVKATTR